MSTLPQSERPSPPSSDDEEVQRLPWLRRAIYHAGTTAGRELVVLCLMTALLLFYGLVPLHLGRAVLSRAEIGLVGADEPRYAQIAYEMLLAHHNGCVDNGNAKVLAAVAALEGPERVVALCGVRHDYADTVRPPVAGETGAVLLAHHELLQRVWRQRLGRAASLVDRRVRHGVPDLFAHATFSTGRPP